MATDLEERVRNLERFRYRALARINALQTMAVGAWGYICLKEDDPVALAQQLIDGWKKGATSPAPSPGIDPAHLDVLSQEYEQVIAELSDQVMDYVRTEATRLGRPRRD